MFIFFVLVALLVGLTPAFGILGGVSATGLIAAIMAAAVVANAIIMRPTTLGHLARILRPGLVLALLASCAWILLQALPTPPHWLSNTAWASASSALNLPMNGAITIDIGATLLSLARYLTVLAIVIIVATIVLDRQHARIILYLLTALTTLAALFQIVSDLGYLGLPEGTAEGIEATGRAAIGVILSCAIIISERDRLAGRRDRRQSRRLAIAGLLAALAAFVICVTAISIHGDTSTLFAALIGAGLPVGIFVIRKWRFGIWGKAGVAAVIAITAFSLFAAGPIGKDTDLATALSPSSQTAVERMLADAPMLGSGAGSFDALVPIYRDIGKQPYPQIRPAAATITIEMGRTFLWASLLILLSCAVVLVACSLSRGRDYVYAAAGAGTIVAFCIMIFVNGELLSLATSLVAGAVAGLAWGQSRSGNENAVAAAVPQRATTAASLWQGVGNSWIRIAFISFGLLLAAEAVWILVPEYLSSRAAFSLPFETKLPAPSFDDRSNLMSAAAVGFIRGDLWAESALADASALLKNSPPDVGLERVQDHLIRALRYAPYRSDVWLMLAALGEHNQPPRYELKALLRMAYYTGPNEANLIPFRIKVALGLIGAAADPELQDMIKRDIRLALVRLPILKPSIAAAYKSATPEGRALADRIIAEIDPAYLAILRRP